jgi:hypothetical protein
MSSICLSWNSAGAFMLTVNSFSLSVKLAPRVLEVEALRQLAVRLVDGVGELVAVEFGDGVERRHGSSVSAAQGLSRA